MLRMAAATAKRSSFQRRGAKKQPALPRGSKPSVHNGQLLISTGLHELDEILGGGLAVGTILLVEEDKLTAHSQTLLKYFVAEGFACSHGVTLVSADIPPHTFIRQLPPLSTLKEVTEPEKAAPEGSQSELKIAWRYQQYLLPTNDQTLASGVRAAHSTFSHVFDLSKTLSEEAIQKLVYTPLDVHEIGDTNPFRYLFDKLKRIMEEGNYTAQRAASLESPNVLRIAVHAFCSPLWGLAVSSISRTNGFTREQQQVLQFLHALRGLLRLSLASCVISFPAHMAQPAFIRAVEHQCDTVLQFYSFKGDGAGERQDALSAYDGLVYIRKLPRLNALTVGQAAQDTTTFVFKRRHRRLVVERFHLPPEEQRGLSDKPAEDTAKSKRSAMPTDDELGEMMCAPRPGRPSLAENW